MKPCASMSLPDGVHVRFPLITEMTPLATHSLKYFGDEVLEKCEIFDFVHPGRDRMDGADLRSLRTPSEETS